MNAIHLPSLPLGDVAPSCPLLDEFTTFYRPTSPIERGWIEQATAARRACQDCRRIQATVRTATLRTAVRDWAQNQEDEVEELKKHFNVCPRDAVTGLKRLAPGCRYLISCWERLETSLAADGTWFGTERLEAIQLQGHSALVEDLYFSAAAWQTWLDCLAAQPNPKQPDIDLICRPTVVPKALQDRDVLLWRPDPEESRARLHAMVARELPPLRILEQKLRDEYEDPARAEAQDRALARMAKEEAPLLRELRSHERSYQQATTLLLKVQKQKGKSAPPSDAVDKAYERLVAVPTIAEDAGAAGPSPSSENPPVKRRRIAPPFGRETTASLRSV